MQLDRKQISRSQMSRVHFSDDFSTNQSSQSAFSDDFRRPTDRLIHVFGLKMTQTQLVLNYVVIDALLRNLLEKHLTFNSAKICQPNNGHQSQISSITLTFPPHTTENFS